MRVDASTMWRVYQSKESHAEGERTKITNFERPVRHFPSLPNAQGGIWCAGQASRHHIPESRKGDAAFPQVVNSTRRNLVHSPSPQCQSTQPPLHELGFYPLPQQELRPLALASPDGTPHSLPDPRRPGLFQNPAAKIQEFGARIPCPDTKFPNFEKARSVSPARRTPK